MGGQGHEHGVVPHICDIQLGHVVLLKNIYGVMHHPTNLVFSINKFELAELVTIVSGMQQSYLDIQKSE